VRSNSDTHDRASELLSEWSKHPPRASHFIVTIYGDVVEPRGGILWMGTLIEICEVVGVSESLVRTAVSRLVGAGQLVGERAGRRSYYRLTDRAQVDFAAAARLLFSPPVKATGLLFAAHPGRDARLPVGYVAVGPDLFAGPDRRGAALPEGLVLRAEVAQGSEAFPAFAARHWDLDRHAAAYRRVLERFAPLEALLADGATLSPRDCLVMRLLLVDDFREAVLRDPMLPAAALPADWPGEAARALFARLYLDLSVSADSHVGFRFRDAEGLLSASTQQVRARLETLAPSSRSAPGRKGP
jgi:phenylacetic acid degradation operon negative regulatory protein